MASTQEIGQLGDPIQGLYAALPLEQKVRMLQDHVERNHLGAGELPCCMPYDGGVSGVVRPWRVEDFHGQSVRSFRANTPGQPPLITAADWLNHENTTSFTGQYLLAQVYRYRATQEDAALAQGERALAVLQRIAALAGPDRFGWLCKPFGGRVSDESSPDQNICALAGLWAFLPYAGQAQARWIRALIEAVPRYWERIDYTIDFGDHVWDIRRDASHMRIFLTANRLAHHLLGHDGDLRVAERLEAAYGRFTPRSASLFDTVANDPEQHWADWRPAGEFAGATLLFAPLCINILCQVQPQQKETLVPAMARAIEHGLIGMDPSWYGHYYQHEVRATPRGYVWRPRTAAPPDAAAQQCIGSGKWALHEYPHRLLWMDATSRLPLAYMIYLHQGGAPMPALERIVREIMSRLDFGRLHHFVDPHNDQAVFELQYARRSLTSEVSNYIAAYWLGRTIGFWPPGA